MVIVSGCPRSGTSLTMKLMEAILGENRILGDKFPQEKNALEERISSLKGERSKRTKAYLHEAERRFKKQKEEIQERAKRARDLNPNGFYECQYSVKGISYNYTDRENLLKYEKETENLTCVKIVSQGLLSSDPRFITKIVYLIRHPRAVAKSQENLLRLIETKGKVHTPSMYINVTVQAAQFFLEQPDIPVYFLNYDDLLSEPEKYIKEVCDFLEEDSVTSWEKVKDIVDPKLKRSKPEDIDNELWEDAETIYELFNNKDFQGIVDYLSDRKRKIHQHNTSWTCARTGQSVNKEACKACMLKEDVRENFKVTANKNGRDWRNEPCLFECGFDLSKDEEELLTIEESKTSNFFLLDL